MISFGEKGQQKYEVLVEEVKLSKVMVWWWCVWWLFSFFPLSHLPSSLMRILMLFFDHLFQVCRETETIACYPGSLQCY